MRTILRPTFLAFLLLAAAGCGDDDGGGGGGDTIAIEAVPAEFAATFCSQLRACGSDLFLELFLGGADCEDQFTANIEDQELAQWEAAMERGTLTYDAAAARRCLDAFEALGCDVFGERAPEVCEEALAGQVMLGAACSIDEECVGTAYCDYGTAMCPGTCAARVGTGMPCDRDDACETGTCQAGTCQPPVAAGGACGGDEGRTCEIGTVCLGEMDAMEGECTDIGEAMSVADGMPCDPREGMLCTGDLSCVVDNPFPTTFECRPGVSAGAACRLAFPDQCPADQFCDGINLGMGDVDGTCTPRPTAGMPCGSGVLGGICAASLRCDTASNNCVVVERLGATCASSTQCHSGECDPDSNTCVAPECD